MPRNRRQVDPEEKQAAIVSAARQLFLQEGYDETTMARIAREAGIASNTVYWYFKDKDALLIVILDQLLTEALAGYEAQKSKPVRVLLQWLLAQFASNRGLIATVHARLSISPAIHEWHDRFHNLLESEIKQQLAARGVPVRQTGAAAMTTMFVLEGLLSHEPSPKQRSEVLRFLASTVGG